MVPIPFTGFGLDQDAAKADGGGYIRWDLAKPNVLLLPGQGYTLVIIAN